MSLKDWWEDMGDTWLFQSAKSIGRAGGDVIQYGSVPLASILFGPFGGLAATPLAILGGQVGPNENRGAQAQRDAISGVAVSAGSGVLNTIFGGNFFDPLTKSFSSLFGWGATPPPLSAAPPKPMSDSDLWKAYFPAPKVPAAAGGSGGFDPLALLGKVFNPNAQSNTAQLQQQYKDQLALAEKFRMAGDTAGAAQAAALAEVYRQQLAAQGVAPSGGGIPPLLLLALLGGGAWLLLRKKR